MAKPNYGFDAPVVTRNLTVIGAILWRWGARINHRSVTPIFYYLSYLMIVTGFVMFILGLSLLIYGVWGKYRMRNLMVGKINWRGNEQVLDVGVGRGLLMNAAAKELTIGRAIGIDIWNAGDLSGNNRANALKNAGLEGVSYHVDVQDMDARSMTFANNSFDVVLSLLCLHNIENKADQEKACFEIARVLKPNGTALVADYLPVGDYANAFTKAGLTVKSSKPYFTTALSLMWMVEATK